MGYFLYADGKKPVKYAVNRTTKKFLEYYVSALESLHYISLDFDRMDYEDKEKTRIEKARPGKPLTFKELERVKEKAYKHIKLEDLFEPNKWSTGFIEIFDKVNLPYFDDSEKLIYSTNSGKLTYSTPNNLLREYGWPIPGFTDRLEETMIVKANALTKRGKSAADHPDKLISEELRRLTDRMMEYFLTRTAILYYEYSNSRAYNGPSMSREYFSIFNQIKIPVIESDFVRKGKRFNDVTFKTKIQYIKFGDAITKKVSELSKSGYDPPIYSEEDYEIYELSWLVGSNFAKEILEKIQNKSKSGTKPVSQRNKKQ